MPVEVYKVMWGPIKWSQSMRPRHAIHNRLFQRVGMKSLIVGKSLWHWQTDRLWADCFEWLWPPRRSWGRGNDICRHAATHTFTHSHQEHGLFMTHVLMMLIWNGWDTTQQGAFYNSSRTEFSLRVRNLMTRTDINLRDGSCLYTIHITSLAWDSDKNTKYFIYFVPHLNHNAMKTFLNPI